MKLMLQNAPSAKLHYVNTWHFASHTHTLAFTERRWGGINQHHLIIHNKILNRHDTGKSTTDITRTSDRAMLRTPEAISTRLQVPLIKTQTHLALSMPIFDRAIKDTHQVRQLLLASPDSVVHRSQCIVSLFPRTMCMCHRYSQFYMYVLCVFPAQCVFS